MIIPKNIALINVTESLAQFIARIRKIAKNPDKQIEIIFSMIDFYTDEYIKHRPIDRIGTILGFYEAINEAFEKSKNINKKDITCRKGCSFCCHIDVDINEDEAAYIVHYCKENNIQINKEYLSKQPAKAREKTEYARCVFLENNECSIYEARPVMCRKHYVVSEPKLCDATQQRQKVARLFDLDMEVLASATCNGSTKRGSMAEMILSELNK